MKTEWKEIDGEHYYNCPDRGWLKKVHTGCVIPKHALYNVPGGPVWLPTEFAGSRAGAVVMYAVLCDPPCTMTPQTSLDVCLEYVVYRVNKVAKGLEPEAREAFLQKVYALKQQFALDVDKSMQEVQK